MKYKQIVCLFLLSLLLVGCSLIPSREIENLGIINTRGIDKIDKDQIESTFAVFQFEGQSTEISKVIFGKGKTLKGTVENAGLASNFHLTPDKVQLEVYGKEAATEGILPYLDTLARDATYSDDIYLSISDTSAKELMTVKNEKITIDIGRYLHGLIEENATDHHFPRVSFQSFMSNFYDIGKDPLLPLFEIVDNVPKLTSIAIMQDDKYVGKVPADNKVFFNLMRDTVEDKIFELSLPLKPFEKFVEKEENITINEDKLHTAYNLLKGKSKTKLIDEANLIFQTEINLRLNLFETSETVLIKDKQAVKLLEKEIGKAIKAKYEWILAQLQEVNSDPFGYGDIYRINKDGGKMTRSEWREKYPKIDVKFKVDANVITHGAVD